jgi:hypothetical protein
MSDEVAQRLARWEQRDAAIGLHAELTEARAGLAARDNEIVDLRERNQGLAQRVAQLVTERDRLARQVDRLSRPPRWRSIARRVAARAARAVRRSA